MSEILQDPIDFEEAAMTDDEFLTAFEECKIPPDLWTHEAHVRLAWIYLKGRPLDAVIPIVREGLIRYALSLGKSGVYHETITRSYLVLIEARIDRVSGDETFVSFTEAHPVLLDREMSALLEHYNRDLLFSTEARERFVEPDRVPLPRLPGG